MYKEKSDEGAAKTAMNPGDKIITDATADVTDPVYFYAGINVKNLTVAGSYSGNITFHIAVS